MLLMVCAIDRLLHGITHSIMERQDLSCTYLAHHELESIMMMIIIIAIIIIIIIIIFSTKCTKKGMHRCFVLHICAALPVCHDSMWSWVQEGW